MLFWGNFLDFLGRLRTVGRKFSCSGFLLNTQAWSHCKQRKLQKSHTTLISKVGTN